MQFHSSSYLCALRFQPLRSGPSSYLSSKFFIEFNLRLRHFDLTNPFREEKNIKAAWSTFKRHSVRFFFYSHSRKCDIFISIYFVSDRCFMAEVGAEEWAYKALRALTSETPGCHILHPTCQRYNV